MPVKTSSGSVVDRIELTAGASVFVPIRAINRSIAIWGEDAKAFMPERWLEHEDEKDDGLSPRARAFQGYHHLLSFLDGPRMCLGKLFAVAEFKVHVLPFFT